ncbi:MAG: hypothetical protein USCAAHI_00182 [Beijerinckiaceae bacterium]|nr:MAG: hypothetical protein USCAAHI_00182 [Beijerinckiaceae bacterium]
MYVEIVMLCSLILRTIVWSNSVVILIYNHRFSPLDFM